tara:strand:- start:17837 stop:17965 length:129 start_codon:yes stop_codon:yes gene_type:complete
LKDIQRLIIPNITIIFYLFFCFDTKAKVGRQKIKALFNSLKD